VGDETEKIRALNAGADDYVTKPFNPDELIARLNAVLRRTGASASEPVIEIGELEVDVAAHQVRIGGEAVHLTKTEFELLRVLAVNRGRLMTHSALLREVWGPGYENDKQVLRVHMANLRRKVERPGGERLIRTDPGVGYRFEA
jgi:two-component system KDP operon response regulator KdpE